MIRKLKGSPPIGTPQQDASSTPDAIARRSSSHSQVIITFGMGKGFPCQRAL